MFRIDLDGGVRCGVLLTPKGARCVVSIGESTSNTSSGVTLSRTDDSFESIDCPNRREICTVLVDCDCHWADKRATVVESVEQTPRIRNSQKWMCSDMQ
jgi:hypothetical protein